MAFHFVNHWDAILCHEQASMLRHCLQASVLAATAGRMMRFSMAVLLWGAATGGAAASSITVLEPMRNPIGPSMVALGSPASSVSAEGAGFPVAAWPSIVVLDTVLPAVSYEKSAAIAPEQATPQSDPATSPMVMRGAFAEDAFVRVEPARTIAPQLHADMPAQDESAAAAPRIVPASEPR